MRLYERPQLIIWISSEDEDIIRTSGDSGDNDVDIGSGSGWDPID